MPTGRLRVKLKSYDHRVIDEAAGKILDTALATGANKDAQEHYEVLVHKRLIDIIDPSERTIDSLSNLDLPAGVSIEIKM